MRFAVTPYAGVWIEIYGNEDSNWHYWVTPYAGVWIEIFIPSIRCVKKFVTPYAGVWIEMIVEAASFDVVPVTPYAGVWIEITEKIQIKDKEMSLPTRECGLKFSEMETSITEPGHSLRGSVD